MLGIENDDNEASGETADYSGSIVDIATAVKDGNTLYYLIIKNENGESSIYTADIRISDILPFLKVNDNVKFTAYSDKKISAIEKITENNT